MEFEEVVATYKALADANRLRIVNALAHRPACGCELVYALGLSQPNLSRHLRILITAGLVRPRREGKWMEYHLAPGAAASLITWLRRTAGNTAQLTSDVKALAQADRGYLCGTGVTNKIVKARGRRRPAAIIGRANRRG